MSVKLDIDFDTFLQLQRLQPSEYTDKRIAITIPSYSYDDAAEEEIILEKVITDRRLAHALPLTCEFMKRDRATKRKLIVKGKVLDFDFKTKRYLV